MRQGLTLLSAVLVASAAEHSCSREPVAAPTVVAAPEVEPPVELADQPFDGEYAPRSVALVSEWSQVDGIWMPVSEDEAGSVVTQDGYAHLGGDVVWLDLTRDDVAKLPTRMSRPVSVRLDSDAMKDPGVQALMTGSLGDYIAGVDFAWAWEVGNDSLRYLAPLAQLQRLDLTSTKITGDGFADLAGMTKLTALTVGGFNRRDVKDDDLARIGELPALQDLTIYQTDITDAGLAHLRGTALHSLRLYGGGWVQGYHCNYSTMPIGAEGLEYLSGLPQLRELVLNHVEMSDAGLVHIGRLTKLRDLDLSSNPITDAGAAHLAGLTELRLLELLDTQVTERGLSAFKGMSELRTLRVPAGGFLDADFEHLETLRLAGPPQSGSSPEASLKYIGELTSLRSLKMRLPVSDAGLAHLSRLTQLESLHINAGELSNAGLAPLSGFEKLHTLYVDGEIADETGSAAAIAELRHLRNLTLPMWDLAPVGKLTELRVFHPVHPVGARELPHLRGLTLLQDLTVGPDVTDRDLVHLEDLGALRVLDLSGSAVTNAGLKHVAGLAGLKELWLVDTGAKPRRLASPGQLDHLEVEWVPPIYEWYEVERRGVCGGAGPWL